MPSLSDFITGQGDGGEQPAPTYDPLSPSREVKSLSSTILGHDPEDAKLSLSVQEGEKRNPDTAARVMKLRAKTGLPGELIERNLDDIEQKANAAGFDAYAFRRSSPAVAGWIAEHPDNYALAREDLSKLSNLEAFWKSINFSAGVRQNQYGRLGTKQRENDVFGRPSEQTEKAIADLEREMQQDPEGGGTFLNTVKNTTQFLGQWGDTARNSLSSGLAVGTAAAGAAAIVTAAGPQIVAEPITVPSAAGAGFMAGFSAAAMADVFATEGGSSYLDMRKIRSLNGERVPVGVAAAASTGVGLLNMGLEMVGARAMVAPFKMAGKKFLAEGAKDLLARPTGQQALVNFAKAYAESVGTEVGTEVLQEVTSIAGEEIAKMASSGEFDTFANNPAVRGAAFERLIDIATQTLEGTALVGGVGAGVHGFSELRQAKQAQQREQLWKAIGDTSKDMKLAKQLPQALQELVGRMTKDGPITDVYIPAQAWVEHFQSKGIDPRAVAKEVIGNTDAYDAAVESGADIAIPTNAYAGKIAPTDHHAAFVKELRTNPAEMNGREAEEFFATAKEVDAEAKADQNQQAALDLLRDDKIEQLVKAGTDPSAAKEQATLYAKVISSLAERTKQDPLALAERFPLDIQRAVPKALQGKGVDTLDLMLDRLRAKNIPSEGEIRGQSLIDFLRDKGLKGDTGEVRDLEIDRALRKPFQRNVVRDDGMALDDAAQAAMEAGYIQERSIPKLLEAMAAETRGESTYATGNENPVLQGERDTLEELQRYIDDAGISLNEDNAAIKAKLAEQAPDERQEAAQTELNQSAYHGSPHKFDKFSLEHMGKGSGQQDYGYGLYFTSQKDVAEYYRESLRKQILFRGKDVDTSTPVGDAANQIAMQMLRGQTFAKAKAQARRNLQAAARDSLSEKIADEAKHFSDAVGAIATIGEGEIEFNKGRLYKVDIAEDSSLLHWQSTVAEQPPKVREAIDAAIKMMAEDMGPFGDESQLENYKSGDAPRDTSEWTGYQVYRTLSSYLGGKERQKYGVKGNDKGASLWFREHGVLGTKFKSENGDYSNYVIYDENAINITEYEQSDKGDKRASIRFGKDRKFTITLFQQANLSSFLHESGHFYLEVLGDLAQEANAPEQVAGDYQKILDWFGVKSRDEITSEHHEKFARGFERYLMEGKAPSIALRGAFARFKAWMVLLYRNVSKLDAPITDEIRGVMDRLVASDDEITAAEQEADVRQVFATAEDAKMSEDEFATYRATVEKAGATARESLERKLIDEYQREREAWWKEARAKARVAVEKMVNARKEYVALFMLRKGTLPDGTPLPEGVTPAKIRRSDLDETTVDRLPKGVTTTKGGISPELAADLLGYRNADELILALINAPPIKDKIEAETDAKMLEEHGDLRLDGSIVEAAKEAVQNDERIKVVQAELIALRRLQRESKPVVTKATREAAAEGQAKVEAEKADRAVEKAVDKAQRKNLFESIPSLDAVREESRRRIGSLQVKDVNPQTYWVAARRSSRLALKAFSSKDYLTAQAAKSKELLNLELYRMASEAKEEIDSAVKFLRSFEGNAARGRLGLAGEDYLEQVDGILQRFSLMKLNRLQRQERETLAQWIQMKEASGESMGEEMSVSPAVLNETNRQHYMTLTVDELMGLRDTIKQINHMAIQGRTALTDEKKRLREDLKDEMIFSAQDNLKDRGPAPLTKNGLTTEDKAKRFLTGWDARLIKMETLIDWLDGGKINGPWRQGLWNGADDAQAKQMDYDKTVGATVAKLVMNMPKEIRKRMSERVSINGISRVVTRRDLLGVALNVGNESNYNKLLTGMGWQPSQVQAMVDMLSAEEIQFVNGVHATLESLWPQIAKLQREMTGLEPIKIEARPFPSANGTIAGGYYPVMYDPVATEHGDRQLSSNVGGLVEQGYTRATTPRGHTKARVENFSAPFDLDIDRLPGHTAGVIKDLTHRRWLVDANWIVNNKQIKATLRERLGDDYVDLFSDWVKQVLNDRNQKGAKVMRGANKLIEKVRYNAMIAGLGFKVSSMVSQFAGIGPSIEVVGKKWVFEGYKRFMAHPVQAMEMIREKSGEMRHRLDTRDQGLHEQLQKLSGRTDAIAEVQRFSMTGLGWADMMVSAPTWIGAYHKALHEGHSDQDAVRSGDRAVRLAQGSGGSKDLSALAADRGYWRLLTMFYTPFSALYSRLRDIGHDVGTGGKNGKAPAALHRAFWTWIFAATMGELLAGHGPDDDEGWLKWWLKAVAVYPFLAIPGIRDIASAVASEYGQVNAPAGQVLKAGTKLANDTVDWAKGDKELGDLATDAFKTSKFLLGLPTGQLEITGSYLKDLMEGDADPDDLGEFSHDLLYRRKHK